MSGVINYLTDLPFTIRVMTALFFLIFIVWKLLGGKFLWVFSIIPFLIKWFFRGVSLVIQEALGILHKKIGYFFSIADGKFSELSGNLDVKIEKWHQNWKGFHKINFKECLLIYSVFCILIIFPSYINTDNKLIKSGENIFLEGEELMLKYIYKGKWYNPKEKLKLGGDWIQEASIEKVKKNQFEVTLIVTGLNTTLLVRDVPYKENSIVLDNLYNDDCVIWNGEIVFSYIDNRVEPWAKITTGKGITGWSRMDYLYPKEYESMIYYVTKSQKEK